jgi:hypothetical protein
VCTRTSEESELEKISGGVAPSWHRQRKVPKVVRGRFKNEFQAQALKVKVREGTLSHFRENSSRRRNQRSGFAEGNSEIPSTIRSQESCTSLV